MSGHTPDLLAMLKSFSLGSGLRANYRKPLHDLIANAEGRRSDLLAALQVAAKNADTEGAHGDADDALIAYINDPEIKAAYEAVDKWYA